MATTRKRKGFSPEDSDSESSSASEDNGPRAAGDKDSEEEELERLVLGNKKSFRENLFTNRDLLNDSNLYDEIKISGVAETGDLEDVADRDLFMIDTGGTTVAKTAPAVPNRDEDEAAWEDSDDERLTISLASVRQNRQLRVSEADDLISGTEYSLRLRLQYQRLHPPPAWASRRDELRRRRRASSRSSSDASTGDDDDDDGSGDDDVSARPLDIFLRDINRLAGREDNVPSKRWMLRPETIGIERLREIPDRHARSVQSLCFHPEYPVLLSASASSVLFLHHVAPESEPPNPRLTSVRAAGVDIRNAEFLLPRGDAIFFAGRRRFFHHWDLPSGVVRKTDKMLGHQLEHRTMENFRLSPCGRYMAIVASAKKGGGIVNLIGTATMQWIAAARLQSTDGVADFAWWRTGDGLTVLGRDGFVGEYCVESRDFIAVWHDDGCVGATVVALGGRGGPDSLGCDRWIAVGSGTGITNVYDRNQLIVSGAGAVTVRERPTPKRVLEQLVTAVSILTFSPDGQLLAFGSLKKDSLRLVHLPSCTVYRNWPTQQTPLGRITAVAFNRESDLLAVGNDKGKIRLWKIRR
ncbi:small nucleolar ribonucleoprotein complex subunit [Ophiocordyceps camponoti-floridani]|uniref:Small nucleolar ribonucleoprotein complex subunit n=1 Tax=Ophiocordyceps camponoti-floridani TaxID=2030778 RepID=A0A8H4VG66_9HYPO|nr:small nucleolar ribonucleoprotein complex subunit [Ophiocordyceps camponoti-floridani]